MGIVVIGAVFVDIKGFPIDAYIPTGRNAGHIKYIHGGVSRNVVEDIANVELRPTFLSIVDESALGQEVIHKLQRHKVNTKYIQQIPEGMGTWLAVFSNDGDLAGSISQRPNLMPILDLVKEKGEAGIFFAENYSKKSPKDLCEIISQKMVAGAIKSMVVTMGSKGSIYADHLGNKGICPAKKVTVRDTTGAGDAFCAGLTIGLTYGKDLKDSVEIGTKLAASVITSSENVCPRFLPRELGLEIDVTDE